MTNAERLRAHLKERGIKHRFLAERLGCTTATLSRMLAGRAIPNNRRKFIIEGFTEGAVPANAWGKLEQQLTRR